MTLSKIIVVIFGVLVLVAAYKLGTHGLEIKNGVLKKKEPKEKTAP